MGNKGFIRTTEAVIAVLLVFTLFSYLSQRVSAPLLNINKDTTPLQDSILNMISPELKTDLAACDLSRVQYLVNTFKPGDMSSKMEITEISPVIATPSSNISSQNVSFTYNFPDYVDPNSVSVYSKLNTFNSRVNWVWYEIPINVQNDITPRVNYDILFTNVKMGMQGVDRNSLAFYWNNKQTPIDLLGFNDYGSYSLANVSVRIPSLNAGETGTGYLFFAVNYTTFNQTYSSLEANNISYTTLPAQQSSRGDVILSLKNFNNSDTLYIEYKMGSNSNVTYPNITNVDNSGISFAIVNPDLKPCTPLQYEQQPASTFYTTTKIFYYSDSSISMELKMWYPWV